MFAQRMPWQRLWLLALGLILSLFCYASTVTVPELKSRVTDLTGTLSSEQQAALEQKLATLEQAKGSQLALLIVPSTGDETIEQYGIRVTDAWQLGRKGVDDGVLLLIAKNDRAVRIEVGRGLEGALPDVIASRIIREDIIPAFKSGDFAGGANAGIDKISAVIQGETLPEANPNQSSADSNSQLPFVLLIPLLMLGGVLRRVVGFMMSFAITSVLSTLGLLYFGLSFLLAMGIGAFIGLIVSSKGGGVSSGGGGFGGGGSFGGGGGFSGGGGSFGGGGASGRW